MSRWTEPISLQGVNVRLEPLEMEHAQALSAATEDGKLWELWYTNVPALDDMGEYIEKALLMREENGAMPFAVVEIESGDIVGSTRFFNVDEQNRRAEIGYTWYARRVQRSAVNTASKLLLLQHAFERLGAKQDGILRHHQKSADGLFRDTVVFSIIAPEWPTVRQSQTFKLAPQDP